MMSLWTLAFFTLFLSLSFLKSDLLVFMEAIARKHQIQALVKVESAFSDMENSLQTGLTPTQKIWENLQSLPEPWSKLSVTSLMELRACGGALLPTLKRLKSLVQEQRAALLHSYSQSSQALAQATVCISMVPLLGFDLYSLIPNLEQHPLQWSFACAIAFILSGLGALYLLNMAHIARWGGLPPKHRSWILGSQCAGERFLALVRAGTPPDVAWLKSCQFLSTEAPELASAWGHTLWDSPQPIRSPSRAEQSMMSAGSSIRTAVQIGLMEGRPCIDRVETALEALRLDMKTHIERELNLLPTRALKPLFIFIAPALLGLLAFGILLASLGSFE